MKLSNLPVIIGITFNFLIGCSDVLYAQSAKITEELVEFKTYPFSDPDPVPEINRIYPYFYFHGYTNNAVQQKWRMVVLENECIEVYVCPDIGGKVWGAVEKSTGKEFLYFNHVVKFRDVGMRGPWTSGGLEYNFGDIGHIPTGSTPVDYITKENEDGSVSCVVGALDLPSGTKWSVEIKVSPGKAYFETKSGWFNKTELPCTYYHWMNAAAKAADDLELIYPGKNWIGHGTQTGTWPEENGRQINWYRENNFGSYKSYHVVNAYANFFGGYYHDENFGFGHLGDFDEKPGKKLWIWGLAPQGMIWENLLSDTDGQYIEFQAGKLFNQAANSSTLTPFKHKEFFPHDSDIMNEIWFPLKETGGMVAASEYAVFNLVEKDGIQKLLVSALQQIDDELKIYKNDKLVSQKTIKLKPLELFETELNSDENLKIVLGPKKLIYSTQASATEVNRPLLPSEDFDWESAYGLFTKGLELEKQRMYKSARDYYEKTLQKEPGYLPALNRMALSHYRQMNYSSALDYLNRSLAIDTYDGEANYLFGLVCRETGDIPTSKSGFSIAMGNVAYRSAAATELANLFLSEKDFGKAERYSEKALAFNQFNVEALQTLAIAKRKMGNLVEAKDVLNRISELDRTNQFARFELYLISKRIIDSEKFLDKITNELPHETFLDLAINYNKKGCYDEANKVLKLAPRNPVVSLWLAQQNSENKESFINEALNQSPEFVLPHRLETAKAITPLLDENPDWKLRYYLGLIYWNKGLIQEAKEQFIACGSAPDFAPFYLAKMKLLDSKEDQLECVKKALELEPENWRAALALTNFYNSEKQHQKALTTIEPFLKKQPEQSAIGLNYGQTLIYLEDYNKAISFLEKYTVLPFEGATRGRDLFREACIRSAIKSIESGKYNKTIKLVEKAKLWPENLGVGRPYDVDERLEDNILVLVYGAKGDTKSETEYAEKVLNYKHPEYQRENSRLYLQLSLLKEKGKEKEAEKLLTKFLKEDPESKYLRWVEAKYKNSKDAEQLENKINQESGIVMPFDPKYIDRNFELLLDFLEVVEN